MQTVSELWKNVHKQTLLNESFYRVNDAPTLPNTILSYEHINSIERNIDLIRYLIDCMVSSFKKVGVTKSNTTMILPIRR